MLYYFPHPSNMRLQREVIALRRQEGAQGYGIYIMILELMRDSEGQKVYDDPDTIAFALHEDDVSLISRICHDYSLFTLTEDRYLMSSFLEMCQQQADERKSKAREWGKAGAKARYSRADQQQPSPSPAQDPPEPGPQTPPQHAEVTYRVPMGGGIDTPCINTNNQTKGEGKERKNQPTKSKLPELEWIGIPGSDWLDLCRSSEMIDDTYIEVIMSEPAYPGRNPILLVDWIRKFGMSRALFEQLEILTGYWTVENPVFQALLKVLKHTRDTKMRPQHPSEFLISTAIKFYRDDT